MAVTVSQQQHIDSYKELLQSTDYESILLLIREKKFSRKNVSVTPRELNNWASKDLLYNSHEDTKWKKFCIVDIIWIQIINELRKYELPLLTLKKLKDNLKSGFDIQAVFENSQDELIEVIKAALSEDLRKLVTVDLLKMMIDELKNKIAPKDIFEIIVVESYLLKYQNRLVVNFDGVVSLHSELYAKEFFESEDYKFHFEKSNISISINALIASVFQDYSSSDLMLNWKLISEDESKILEAIQTNKKVKSIKVRFNQKSEIDLLEIVDEIKITPQDYLKKIMMEGDYMDIKIITQNGQVVLCERTIKQKI